MKASKLYKYLDVDGGLAMLSNSNMQFTNATKLNDPFDCHPSLIDFSNVPAERMKVWGKDLVMKAEHNRFEQYRDNAWICSLSKVDNSLLMWSYYSNHRGVCIGLDMEKVRKCLYNTFCVNFIGAIEMEIQYKEIINRPDYFHDYEDYFRYLLSTKAKEWEHEKEVRLLLMSPVPSIIPDHPSMVSMALPYEPKDKTTAVDWREARAYHKISGECFDSVYLGVNIDEDKRNQIIEAAKNLNPDIKICQMKVDADAFRLHTEQIY